MAFVPGDKLKLYLQATTWLVGEPKFYGDKDNDIKELIRAVASEDPQYVLKLAVYARDVMHLRTAPQVMLVECSLIAAAKTYVRSATRRIVQRPDEMATCVAYLISKIGHLGDRATKGSMPACLKRGLADAFRKFSEYQLQKYNTQRRSVKLRDVMRLVHPKPMDVEQSAMWKRLIAGTLATPETWETIVSESGSNTESWTRAARVMPYMALLRNLRNLIQNGVDPDKYIHKLNDERLILKSRQFPYRFFSAYREVAKIEGFDSPIMLGAIERAMATSIRNLPRLPGRTMVAADNSGSMGANMSERSDVEYRHVANLSLAIASTICEKYLTGSFASEFKTFNLPPGLGLISAMNAVGNVDVGYSTEGWKVVNHLLENKIHVDRIIIFSDMVLYDKDGLVQWGQTRSLYEELQKYRRTINPKAFLYLIDLSGYGTIQMPESDKNTALISGFSGAVFNFIGRFEAGPDSQLKAIDAIEL